MGEQYLFFKFGWVGGWVQWVGMGGFWAGGWVGAWVGAYHSALPVVVGAWDGGRAIIRSRFTVRQC